MLKDVKDAMRYANEANELYPENPQSYMVLGELYDSVNEDELAEKFCRQAIFHNDAPNCKHPLNAHNVFFSLCCLGGSLIKQQKYSEAEKFLTKAAKVDQDSTLALRQLVEVYAQQDRKEFAILTAKRVVEIETAASTPCEVADASTASSCACRDIACGTTSFAEHPRSRLWTVRSRGCIEADFLQ